METNSDETEEEIGDRNQDWDQQEANRSMEINNENVELGGDEITTIEEIEGFSEDGCTELRERERRTSVNDKER